MLKVFVCHVSVPVIVAVVGIGWWQMCSSSRVCHHRLPPSELNMCHMLSFVSLAAYISVKYATITAQHVSSLDFLLRYLSLSTQQSIGWPLPGKCKMNCPILLPYLNSSHATHNQTIPSVSRPGSLSMASFLLVEQGLCCLA